MGYKIPSAVGGGNLMGEVTQEKKNNNFSIYLIYV